MIVHVMVEPLLLVLGIVRLRRRLQVRPPVADGGEPDVWEPIEPAVLAAVQAGPAALAHLSRRLCRAHCSRNARVKLSRKGWVM